MSDEEDFADIIATAAAHAMSRQEWNDLMYCSWDSEELKRQALLYDLALCYEERCESYDRRICALRNSRGVAIPSTSRERALCGRNALAVREEILYMGASIGVTWKEILEVLNSLP